MLQTDRIYHEEEMRKKSKPSVSKYQHSQGGSQGGRSSNTIEQTHQIAIVLSTRNSF